MARRRARPFLRFALLATIVALLLGGWAFWWEPSRLVLREYPLEIPGWPTALSGLRVAVLADLHISSPFNGLDRLQEIVDRTNAQSPDLILLPGDFVIHGVWGGEFVEPADFAHVLARLQAPLGKWAVLGNHDWWYDADDVQQTLEAHGIRFLEDRAVSIDAGTPFWLLGISDLWEAKADVTGALSYVTDDAPILAFTHNPDVFPRVPERVRLTIAGHSHGGQVKIPLFGRPIVPSRFGERFAIGHVVEDDRHLFVSTGIGTSILPVRFLTPPEISILRLVSGTPAPSE